MLGLSPRRAAGTPVDRVAIARERLETLERLQVGLRAELDEIGDADGDDRLEQLAACGYDIEIAREALASEERRAAAASEQQTAAARAARQSSAEQALRKYEDSAIEFEQLLRKAVDHFTSNVLPAWQEFRAATPDHSSAETLGTAHRPPTVFARVTAYMAQRINLPTGHAAPSRRLETLAEVFGRKRSSLLPWKE